MNTKILMENSEGGKNMSIVSAYMVPHPPLIIPEIGNGKEKTIQKTIDSYKEIAKEIVELNPDTVVIATPHVVSYADYIHISPGKEAVGDFRDFGTRYLEINAEYDMAFVDRLCDIAEEKDFMAGKLGERDKKLDHATMIPLYFIKEELNEHFKGKIVRIGISGLSLPEHYRLGMYVKEVSESLGRKTVFIASGDLSHRLKDTGPYGYRKEGPEYDERIMDTMGRGDFGKLFEFNDNFCHNAGECGHKTFLMLAGALDGKAVESKRLSYEGPFGVGYGVCSFKVVGDDETREFLNEFSRVLERKIKVNIEHEDEYVGLARKSLEAYVLHGVRIPIPESLSGEILNTKAGAFVSIKINGRLRGCIGTISSTKQTLAEEIIENAISAGMRDPRFPPITKDELSTLEYSVDVLGEAEEIESKVQLDAKKYGVIVSQGFKRGLLLPNLEGIETVEEQISVAKQKAGIEPEDDNVKLHRFEVIRHK